MNYDNKTKKEKVYKENDSNQKWLILTKMIFVKWYQLLMIIIYLLATVQKNNNSIRDYISSNSDNNSNKNKDVHTDNEMIQVIAIVMMKWYQWRY